MWKFQGLRPTIFCNSPHGPAVGGRVRRRLIFAFFSWVFLDLLVGNLPGVGLANDQSKAPLSTLAGRARGGLL